MLPSRLQVKAVLRIYRFSVIIGETTLAGGQTGQVKIHAISENRRERRFLFPAMICSFETLKHGITYFL